MTNTDRVIQLYGILSPGALYPMKLIKERYNDYYDDVTKKDLDNLGTAVRSASQSKEKIPLIIKHKIGNTVFYKLNEKINAKDNIDSMTSRSVEDMAKSLLKIVISENNKNLSQWLNSKMIHVMKKLIAEKVEHEFAEEILPVLIQNIDAKIVKSTKITKNQFKTMLVDVLDDGIKRLKGTINS